MTWSICRLCSFCHSVTSSLKIWHPINIRWVAIKIWRILLKIWRYITAIQWILDASQIRGCEVQQLQQLHILCIDHLTIWSELKKLKCNQSCTKSKMEQQSSSNQPRNRRHYVESSFPPGSSFLVRYLGIIWLMPGTRRHFQPRPQPGIPERLRTLALSSSPACNKGCPHQTALILVQLCRCWVRTSWVDPSAHHAADIVFLLGLNSWRGRMKIRVEMTKYIPTCTIHRMINVPCIALTLCSTSCTSLWRDTQLACSPCQQTMVDGGCGERNGCQVEFINQWSILHSHLSYAIEVCPVNMIHNISLCKSNLAFLNGSSRKWIKSEGTLNLPHEGVWGVSSCPLPIARLPFSGSP